MMGSGGLRKRGLIALVAAGDNPVYCRAHVQLSALAVQEVRCRG